MHFYHCGLEDSLCGGGAGVSASADRPRKSVIEVAARAPCGDTRATNQRSSHMFGHPRHQSALFAHVRTPAPPIQCIPSLSTSSDRGDSPRHHSGAPKGYYTIQLNSIIAKEPHQLIIM